MIGARDRWNRIGRRLLPGVVSSLLTASGLAAAPVELLEGAPVREIEIRSDAPIESEEEILELLAIERDRPLARDAVARSLRNLHSAGLAGETEILAVASDDGLKAVVVLHARVRVSGIRLEGELGLKQLRLEKVLLQRVNEPLVESRLVRGVYGLLDLFEDEGYRKASVRLEVSPDPAGKTVEVVYRIDSGPVFAVGEVHLEGDLGAFTAEDLVARLKASPGSRLRRQLVRDDGERLESWLLRQGHRMAVVGRVEEEQLPDEPVVNLVHPVDVGPRVEIEVVGASGEELRKEGVLDLLESERYDTALVLQSVGRLRGYFQRLGHHRVEIDWWEERDEQDLRLVLMIDPGPLFELGEIVFDGNREVDSIRLASLMTSQLRVSRRSSGRRLVDEVLEEDLGNIRSFYLLAGYQRSRVGPEEVTDHEGVLTVRIPIVEGPRSRVVDLSVDGADSTEPAALLAGLPLTSGGPFHPSLLEQAREQIRARYEDAGFQSIQVSAELEWNGDETLVDVHLRVLEGPRSVVERIILRGHRKTDPRLVSRAARLQPGEPLSTARLLEVQRRLYALGIFSSVEMRPVSMSLFSGRRDVLIRVEEAPRQHLTYGVGYDSEDGIRGLLGYSRTNLFGRAVSGRIDLLASQREKQVRALLRQPFVGRWSTPVTYSLFRIQEEFESFTSKRRGTQVELQSVRRDLRLNLLYTYKIVEVVDADPVLEDLLIDRDLQEVEISSLSPNLLFDRRDALLDPTRGWSSGLLLEYAFPMLAADAEFFKLFGQQTGYLNLRRFGVVAASLRAGIIEPLGTQSNEDPSLPEELPSRLVPISERFFAGGRATHRAYHRDLLGIPGETLLPVPDPDNGGRLVPVGGNGMLLLNLDYRFPIAGEIGGTLFFDAGNVWADWRSIAVSELKKGVGVGVRYRSPIGPLRLEVGWKLDREEWEDSYVVFLSFGNPF